MKNKLFFAVWWMAGISVYGQVIRVVNYENKAPVPQVSVYQPDKGIYLHTDDKGQVDISIFHLKDTLYFSHPDFETIRLTKQQIIANKYRVELYRNMSVLNTVVLSVSRHARKSGDIPREVKVFDAAELEQMTVSEVPDLLLMSPGLSVQRTQGGAGSPVIRGLEANRILLVIDGVRMNNVIYHAGHMHHSITVEPAILERVEIISGPSAIYGSDALGGVIHFITKTPVVNSRKTLRGGFTGRFATATRESTFNLNWTVSKRQWASLTSLTYSDFGDITMGTLRLHGYEDWGIVHEYSDNDENHYNAHPVPNPHPQIQPNTGYKQYDFFNKTVVECSPVSHWIFDTQFHTTSDIPRFDKLTEYKNGQLKYAEWRYGPMQRLLFSPQWEWKPGGTWIHQLKIIPSFQNIHESRITRKFGSLIRKYQKENLYIGTLNVDAEAKLKNRFDINYGLEWMYNNLHSRAYGKKLLVNGNQITGLEGDYYVPSRYPNGHALYSHFAFYTDMRKRFNKRHLVELGMRFTQTYLDAAWEDLQLVSLPFQQVKLGNFAFTPMLSYIFSPDTWKFSINLGSGFRSPNIDDIGKIREKHGKLLVPNTGLKPEYSYYGEAGIIKRFPVRDLSLKVFGYYNILHHYIDRRPFTLEGLNQLIYDGDTVDLYANVNNGNAAIYGVDVMADWNITHQLKWHADMSWAKGRKADGTPLPSIPPLKIFSSVEVDSDYFDFILSALYFGRKSLDEYDVIGGVDNLEQTPVDPQTGQYTGYPSWYIVNFYFKFNLTHTLTLNLGVENLFDIHYKRFASAVSEPGRNFKIQITGKF